MNDKPFQPYVLMIEDDADDLFLADYWLNKLEIKIPVQFISDSFQVFSWLAKQQQLPSLIVLDKRLPGIDGIELLKQLKAHSIYKAIPVIIISGTGWPEEISEFYMAGASSYILKPNGGSDGVGEGIKCFAKYWFSLCQLPQLSLINN
jgi:two-component system response regulator